MFDQYKYRNELLKKYLLIGFVTSVLLSPIYYKMGINYLAISLNIFSVLMVYLFINSKKANKYIYNSRFFMITISILFIIGFLDGNQEINSMVFVLLYPIASFSIRGPKEGILWSIVLLSIFISIFTLFLLPYNKYSFLFFCVAYLMVSYLLYFYRYYEIMTFKSINEELENIVKERTKELEISNKKLEKLASTDVLTKLLNRGKLNDFLESEINRASRFNHIFGVIIMDIDHFKSTNDIYGHNVGDKVLEEFATILKTKTRVTDIVGRWGGEEFVIICPQTDIEGIKKLAEELRYIIENNSFSIVGNKTASFGITLYCEGDTIKSLISRADKALYRAKEEGRNKVVVL
ncbi:diguanylate cyclase [Arcobacter nitrofigilis DSM 7299]|uniref:diguanylate cyclase n=1 Tax=Arcobacter nitrofigilis (strain ATCC 33309 / DSM 7299 / CCUG 15893 / LMG 7604 / NCTC 12251 / CI) TaxID=572480 RepID=D5V6U2_ARCNC|nr:diguanylate cyclase [Arcobacter nitrofigilis]ADG94362.1 diguanylate cyclase [Arcobacter nitrofigilis DSM 7299]